MPSLRPPDAQYPARTQSFEDNGGAKRWSCRTPTAHDRLLVPVLPVHHRLHKVAPSDEVRHCKDSTVFTLFQLVETRAQNPKPGSSLLNIRSARAIPPNCQIQCILNKLYPYCVDVPVLLRNDFIQCFSKARNLGAEMNTGPPLRNSK